MRNFWGAIERLKRAYYVGTVLCKAIGLMELVLWLRSVPLPLSRLRSERITCHLSFVFWRSFTSVKKLPPLILSVALVLSVGQARADFDAGVAAYELSDFVSALREFRLSAIQGDARAQYMLGLMHAGGHGMLADHIEAMRWFRRAANQGHAKSQFELGVMHQRGLSPSGSSPRVINDPVTGFGVAPAPNHQRLGISYAEAAKWYGLAANQGLVEAQYNLGLMYASGGGVPEDYVRAYVWWTVAKRHGNEQAATKLKILEPLMSRKDIVDAESRADEWWKQNP